MVKTQCDSSGTIFRGTTRGNLLISLFTSGRMVDVLLPVHFSYMKGEFVCVCVCASACVRACACVCVYKVRTELVVECDAFHHALVGQGLFCWGLGEQSGSLDLVLALRIRQEERGWSRHPCPSISMF